jgi:predicted nucleotidyltransferase
MDVRALYYYYSHMARGNAREYLFNNKVRLKKYFYVLRPLLAARWVANTGSAAPIEFEKLLTLLQGEPAVLEAVRKLLEQKRHAPELGLAPAVPVLNDFIEAELDKEPIEVPQKSSSPRVVDQLNALFHGAIREYAVGTN